MTVDDTIAGLTGAIYGSSSFAGPVVGRPAQVFKTFSVRESSYLIRHGIKPSAPDMTVLVERDVDQAMRLVCTDGALQQAESAASVPRVGRRPARCTAPVIWLRGRSICGVGFTQEWAMPQGWFDYAGVTLIPAGRISRHRVHSIQHRTRLRRSCASAAAPAGSAFEAHGADSEPD